MMISSPCNVCGSDKYREICDVEILPFDVRSKLVKCNNCGFFYINPRLTKEVEEEGYKKHYYESQKPSYWYDRRIDIFERALNEINKFSNKGRLIDIGCGMGYFMDLARKNGWEVKGVEISESAVSYASRRLKLDVIKGNLKDAQFKRDSFDVATMWNVLDQMYDPRDNLIEVHRILKKEGHLLIRVPNLYFYLVLSRFYNRLRRLFKNIVMPPSAFHLYPLDKNSMNTLLKSAGFSNVIIKTEKLSENNPYFINRFGKRRERIIRMIFGLGAQIIYLLSLRKIVISPSIFVIAQKQGSWII